MESLQRTDLTTRVEGDDARAPYEAGRRADDGLGHPRQRCRPFCRATVGLPDDLCPCPHWGYMIKGRVSHEGEGRRHQRLRCRPSLLLGTRTRARGPRDSSTWGRCRRLPTSRDYPSPTSAAGASEMPFARVVGRNL